MPLYDWTIQRDAGSSGRSMEPQGEELTFIAALEHIGRQRSQVAAPRIGQTAPARRRADRHHCAERAERAHGQRDRADRRPGRADRRPRPSRRSCSSLASARWIQPRDLPDLVGQLAQVYQAEVADYLVLALAGVRSMSSSLPRNR